jgi:hypothetical protein
MADPSRPKNRDRYRQTYEFSEGQKVPVKKSKFETFKTEPGAVDDDAKRRAKKNIRKKKSILEQLN